MKKFVYVVVALLILAAIPITVFLGMRSQELRKKAAPATNIALSPASVTKSVNDEFTLEARIDTADNQVVATQINIVFDPEKLEAISITNGTLFPNILSSGVVGNGTASIAVGAANTTTPVHGTGTAAVIKFKALAATTSPITIRFASDTFVGALGEGSNNVLIGTSPTTVTITGGDLADTTSLTPTPLPTEIPTTTDGATPSPTPTLALTLTPTPTATDSATPSAQVKITTPSQDESVATTMPTFIGKAAPGSVVTIVIHSAEEITTTVTTDANGNWTYTINQPLSTGPHTVVVAANDPQTNTTSTATIAFVVATGSENGASNSATPVSGSVGNTILFIMLGVMFILIGTTIPLVSRNHI